MASQNLDRYFEAVGVKRLSAVDIDKARSHQHEFGCPLVIAEAYGRPTERQREPARYMYFADDEDTISVESSMTIYDARAGNPNRSAEFRLYYPENEVIARARVGDLLVVAKRAIGNRLLILIAEDGSSFGAQLLHLFGLDAPDGSGFNTSDRDALAEDALDLVRKLILEEIDESVTDAGANWLDEMIERYGDALPTTSEFSAWARSTLPELDAEGGPDDVLIAWMDRELDLFNTFDAYLLGSKIEAILDRLETHGRDYAQLEALFLSRQNQRKSRAGHALENHMEAVLDAMAIRHVRNHTTENRSKPDFLFPGGHEYDDPSYPAGRLTMLGVKRTLKDRWRQVLTEADRIDNKHLLTLQAPVSEKQTGEMQARKLTLVVPRPFHELFTDDQVAWLISVDEFLQLVSARETRR